MDFFANFPIVVFQNFLLRCCSRKCDFILALEIRPFLVFLHPTHLSRATFGANCLGICFRSDLQWISLPILQLYSYIISYFDALHGSVILFQTGESAFLGALYPTNLWATSCAGVRMYDLRFAEVPTRVRYSAEETRNFCAARASLLLRAYSINITNSPSLFLLVSSAHTFIPTNCDGLHDDLLCSDIAFSTSIMRQNAIHWPFWKKKAHPSLCSSNLKLKFPRCYQAVYMHKHGHILRVLEVKLGVKCVKNINAKNTVNQVDCHSVLNETRP